MTINIPCWTTSKEEANKLVDELSEGCYEYGKDESKEKMLDVFYKTKALKNYVGIMQGRIELLNARIAELEGAQRWIPVSERLPEEEVTVLATGLVKGVHDPFCWHYTYSTRGWFKETFTHWMPMPELPKEARND